MEKGHEGREYALGSSAGSEGWKRRDETIPDSRELLYFGFGQGVGKIVAKNLRGKALTDKLEELLSGKKKSVTMPAMGM